MFNRIMICILKKYIMKISPCFISVLFIYEHLSFLFNVFSTFTIVHLLRENTLAGYLSLLSHIRRGFVELRTEWRRCDWLIPLSWQNNHNKLTILDWFFLLRLYTFVIVLTKFVTIRVDNELKSLTNHDVIMHLEFVVWYLSQVKKNNFLYWASFYKLLVNRTKWH